MRWLGALLLILAGAAVGRGKTAAIRRQMALLGELSGLICRIGAELRQRGTPLPDILHQYPSGTGLPLKPLEQALRQGQTVLSAAGPWLKQLEPHTARVLENLCAVLGRYDGETQALACDQALRQLEREVEELRLLLAEKGRLYHVVPLTLGMMAALVLF